MWLNLPQFSPQVILCLQPEPRHVMRRTSLPPVHQRVGAYPVRDSPYAAAPNAPLVRFYKHAAFAPSGTAKRHGAPPAHPAREPNRCPMNPSSRPLWSLARRKSASSERRRVDSVIQAVSKVLPGSRHLAVVHEPLEPETAENHRHPREGRRHLPTAKLVIHDFRDLRMDDQLRC
jgi:hypothetical protein